LAVILRIALRAAEYPYTLVVVARNRRYDHRSAMIQKVAVPVISVGNLTLGGTGKTPMVQFLAKRFREREIRVAIVSRGYRAASGQRNDEARELAEKLPDVPHLQNPDRVAAARVAVDELGAQLVVLDDGFQHRRLARDLDIVLVDALEPFGYGHVFPRGMLREPVSGLNRADIVALSRADLIDHARRDEVRQRVAAINPRAVFIEVAHCARQLLGRDASEEIAAIRGKRVAAFCGLGNPEGFRRTLEQCAARIVAFREFPDHHDYSDEDIRSLGTWSQDEAAEMVVCTHKDLVKIDIDSLQGIPLRALIVELAVQSGGGAFEQKLSELVAVKAV
jgi:tetraacyldisaccharide 4'-kinase